MLSHDSEEDTDFHFWGASNTSYYDEKLSSDQLWKGNTSKKDTHEDSYHESSPLLPHNHHSTNLSSSSTRRAIEEGRRQLMEKIKDMPESCYELSLKDIVETEHQVKKQKKKNNKVNQMSRISSMKSETFLLKIFFPTFLALKKQDRGGGNGSKGSPGPCSEGAKQNIGKEYWWMSIFLLAGDSKRSQGGKSSTSSHEHANFVPGCWSFFHSKKNKTKRHRGCVVEIECK